MEKLKELNGKYLVVHYSRGLFREVKDEGIFSLHIYRGDRDQYKSFEFDGTTDSEQIAINYYAKSIKEALADGLVILHWNQNSSEYGVEHIQRRYKEITGESLELSYGENALNLAALLVAQFGDDYSDHPRLDSIAIMNDWHGFDERSGALLDSTRLRLIVKILHRAMAGTLKTRNELLRELEAQKFTVDRLRAELKMKESNEDILDRKQIIELLGISASTLTNWVAKNELPFHRIGRRLYFLKSEILNLKNQ